MSVIQTTPEQLNSVLQGLELDRNSKTLSLDLTGEKIITSGEDITATISDIPDSWKLISNKAVDFNFELKGTTQSGGPCGFVDLIFYTIFPKDSKVIEFAWGNSIKRLNMADAKVSTIFSKDNKSRALRMTWKNPDNHWDVSYIEGCFLRVHYYIEADLSSETSVPYVNAYDENNNSITFPKLQILELDDLLPDSIGKISLTFDNGTPRIYESEHRAAFLDQTFTDLGLFGVAFGNLQLASRFFGSFLGQELSDVYTEANPQPTSQDALDRGIYYDSNGSRQYEYNSSETYYVGETKYHEVYYEDTGENWVVLNLAGTLALLTYENIPNFDTITVTVYGDTICNVVGQKSSPLSSAELQILEEAKYFSLFSADNQGGVLQRFDCYGVLSRTKHKEGTTVQKTIGSGKLVQTILITDSDDQVDNTGCGLGFIYDNSGNFYLNFATRNLNFSNTISFTAWNYDCEEPFEIEVSDITASNILSIKNALRAHLDIFVALKLHFDENISDFTEMFKDCTNLVSIDSFPAGVTNLTSCFEGCLGLKTIGTIPDTVTNITDCFKNSGIEVIPYIPAVTSYNGAFDYCRDLKRITSWKFVPQNNLTSLFRCCDKLEGIGCETMAEASAIQNLLLPNTKVMNTDLAPMSITNTGISMGYVPNMKIPFRFLQATLDNWPENTIDSPYIIDVTELTDAETNMSFDSGGGDFSPSLLCAAINGYVLDSNNHVVVDSEGYPILSRTGNRYVVLNESADSVSSNHFMGVMYLDYVGNIVGALLDRCTTVKSMALGFYYSPNLKQITFPPNIEDHIIYDENGDIDTDAMFIDSTEVEVYQKVGLFMCCNSCSNLEQVGPLPTKVTFLSDTFAYSGITETPQIPEGVVDLREAFHYCHNLTRVSFLPSTVRNYDECFEGCENLETVPSVITVATTPYNAQKTKQVCEMFSYCSKLTAGPQLVGTFEAMEKTFAYCGMMTTVGAIPNTVKDMTKTFDHCVRLTSVGVLPSGVEKMEETFNTCQSITQMPNIPNTVTELVKTFYQCQNITNVIPLPASIKKMQETFYGCISLTQAVFAPAVEDVTGCYKLCSGLTSALAIPPTCKIAAQLFANCTSLRNVEKIPRSLHNFYNMFFGCHDMNIHLWEAPEHYEEYIGENQIYGTSKADDVFNTSADMQSCDVTVDNLYSFAFFMWKFYINQYKFNTLVMNDEHAVQYRNFSKYLSLVPTNADIEYRTVDLKEVPASACAGNDVAVENTIQYELQNNSTKQLVLSISDEDLVGVLNNFNKTFKGCTSLIGLTIPDSIQYINSMCEGCSNLTHIGTLSDSILSMQSAFKNCDNLTTVDVIPLRVSDMTSAFESANSNTPLTIGFWKPSISATSSMVVTDTFKKRRGTIGIHKSKLSNDSKWYFIKFWSYKNSTTLNYKVYNSTGDVVKTGTIAATSNSVEISGKLDEFITIAKEDVDTTDAELNDILVAKMLKYQKPFTIKDSLDPTDPNFVLWAKDKDAVTSNILYNYAKPVAITQTTTIVLVSHDTKYAVSGSGVTLSFTEGEYSGVKVEVVNTGSSSATVQGQSLAAGENISFMWNGTRWQQISGDSGGGTDIDVYDDEEELIADLSNHDEGDIVATRDNKDPAVGVPLGTWASFANDSAPNGEWLRAGSTFDANTFPALAMMLGGNKVPVKYAPQSETKVFMEINNGNSSVSVLNLEIKNASHVTTLELIGPTRANQQEVAKLRVDLTTATSLVFGYGGAGYSLTLNGTYDSTNDIWTITSSVNARGLYIYYNESVGTEKLHPMFIKATPTSSDSDYEGTLNMIRQALASRVPSILDFPVCTISVPPAYTGDVWYQYTATEDCFFAISQNWSGSSSEGHYVTVRSINNIALATSDFAGYGTGNTEEQIKVRPTIMTNPIFLRNGESVEYMFAGYDGSVSLPRLRIYTKTTDV